MRRVLALAVGLLAVIGRCAPALAQVAPLTSSVSSLTASSGGSGSGDIDSVAITASSPLTGTATCTTGACSFTLGLGTVPIANGGTALTGYTLGDTLYSSATDTLAKLAGNTTTTKKFLMQVGDGVASAAPSWTATAADFPTLNQNTSGNAATATALAANGSNCASGSFAAGVDASGAAEGCTALAIGTNTQAYDADLSALAANSTDGLWAHTASGTGSARTITGTANEITVTNGDGVSGNPTLSLSSIVNLASKTLRVPSSTTLPATCSVGDIYDDTDATSGARLYLCESTNTWAVIGSGGGGGISGLTTGRVPYAASSTTLADSTAFVASVANDTVPHWFLTSLFAGKPGMTIEGAASQTADLLRFQNSSHTVLASISAAGVPDFPGSGSSGSLRVGGGSSASGQGSTAYGNTAIASGNYSTAIGNTCTATGQATIALGFGAGFAQTVPSNTLIAGYDLYNIADVYIGNGLAIAAPLGVTYHGSGGSGTNIAGASITIAGGKGTGTGVSGKVKLQVAPHGSTGSSANALVDAISLTDAFLTDPSTSSDTCTAQELRISATYIYVCTATNTWKRVALSAF